MKRYKLTEKNMMTGLTYTPIRWEIGKEQEASGQGGLCGSGWIHVYTNPVLAVMLNPIHADFINPRIFECECEGKSKTDHGLKEGWTKVTLTKELPLPEITIEQGIKFAILCTKKVYTDSAWIRWAEDWVSG